jgi:hypothetical protein
LDAGTYEPQRAAAEPVNPLPDVKPDQERPDHAEAQNLSERPDTMPQEFDILAKMELQRYARHEQHHRSKDLEEAERIQAII